MLLIDELTAFVRDVALGDFPPQAREMAKNAVRDCISVAVRGAVTGAGEIIAAHVAEHGARPVCAVLGTPHRTSPEQAALANGTLAHALDFDDISTTMQGHPSVALLPAALAVGEYLDAGGAELLLAYLTGYEVQAKLGRIARPKHYAAGFHATGTMGAFGAAAACAKLLELDGEGIRTALGIVSSLAAGLRGNFGTMTKPLHAGRAAQNGVLAAMLARRGFTADRDILFGDCFNRALQVNGPVPEAGVWSRDGSFDITGAGIQIKKYPSCGCTHPALDSLLGILRENAIAHGEIADIRVRVHPWAMDTLLHDRPTTGLEGKFSMQYNMALAAIEGTVRLEHFTDERVNEPVVQELLRRVEVERREDYPFIEYLCAEVRVTCRDGRRFDRYTEFPSGSPQNPMTRGELREKFMQCTRGILPADNCMGAWERLARLEELGRLRELTALLQP